MKVAGFIAEFNPLHLGHEYLINKIKEDNVDLIICAMSPNFVMRGEPAIFNKFERCEIALKKGIDIVAEIPTIYTLESADIYAERGIEILNKLNVTDLYFGVETDDINLFNKCVSSLNSEEYKENIKKYLDSGYSFNQASKKAIEDIDIEYSIIFNNPNNILGIFYLNTIKNKNYNITPHLIKRVDSGYFSELNQEKEIQSATALRKYLLDGKNEKYFSYETTNFNKHVKNQYFNLIKYRISSISTDELKEIHGVSEGLENKIKSLKNINTYDDLINRLISKRNRETKINRILMCILLNIKKNEIKKDELEYIRLLGFKKTSQDYLKSLIKNEINILTSVKKGLPNSLYRELDFTKIYDLIFDEGIIDKEYYPIII